MLLDLNLQGIYTYKFIAYYLKNLWKWLSLRIKLDTTLHTQHLLSTFKRHFHKNSLGIECLVILPCKGNRACSIFNSNFEKHRENACTRPDKFSILKQPLFTYCGIGDGFVHRIRFRKLLHYWVVKLQCLITCHVTTMHFTVVKRLVCLGIAASFSFHSAESLPNYCDALQKMGQNVVEPGTPFCPCIARWELHLDFIMFHRQLKHCIISPSHLFCCALKYYLYS